MLEININNKLIFLTLIICSVSVPLSSGAEIRQVELDDSMLIDTSPTNYAITAPDLNQQQNWKSISVNGNQVNILTSTCQNIVKDSQNLSQTERAQLSNIASRLLTVDSNGVNHQGRYSASRFSLTSGGSMSSSRSGGSGMSSFQSNGLSINKYDDNNYSISKIGLPNGISRLFVSNNDLITFVYTDGRVLMKPIACLNPSESQLFQQLKVEVQQVQQQFQSNMQQMQQNMNRNMMNMQQNMQQNMHQMQYNMGNMFANPSSNFGAAWPSYGNSQAQSFASPSYMNPNYFQQGTYAGTGASGENSFLAPASPMTLIQPMAPMAPMQPMQPMQPMAPMQSMQPMQPMAPMAPMAPFQPMMQQNMQQMQSMW